MDGSSRPWKKGRTAGYVGWQKIALLCKVLDSLKIPHHRAPGEAEAECARLQTLGIVDAVWSDDSDTFLLGATRVLQHYRAKDNERSDNNKSNSYVHLYTADKLKQRFGFDRPALLLFVLLSGGDYLEKGLEGYSAKEAHRAVRWEDGRLGRKLSQISLDQRELQAFRAELIEYFQCHSQKGIPVPLKFPRKLYVGNYRDSKVSTEEQARSLRGLQDGWDGPLYGAKLRPFLRERFQFRANEHTRHMTPVLLVKHLVNGSADDLHKSNAWDIHFVHKRGKTANDYQKERLVRFNPLRCSSLNLATQPADENWSIWTDKKTGSVWDPSEPVETRILNCFLVNGLGASEVKRLEAEASKSVSLKRKTIHSTRCADDVDEALDPSR